MVYSVERSRAPGRCLFGLLRHRSARHPRPIDRPGEGALQLLSVSGVGRDLLAKEASPDPIRSRGMLFRRSGAAALIGGRGRAERMGRTLPGLCLDGDGGREGLSRHC
jgi:hypothetical protein